MREKENVTVREERRRRGGSGGEIERGKATPEFN